MDNANNSSIILDLNKQDQIKALREAGFTDLADNATWTDIVAHMRWAGGLRDIQVPHISRTRLKTRRRYACTSPRSSGRRCL